jgi:hypothetical protein
VHNLVSPPRDQATRTVRRAEPAARVALTVQQPAVGKIHPVPHSSPGRWKLLPSCGSGPHTGVTTALPGPVALIERSPCPVIRQTILISVPAVSNGPVGKNRPHSVAPVPTPCLSGSAPDRSSSAAAGQVEAGAGPDGDGGAGLAGHGAATGAPGVVRQPLSVSIDVRANASIPPAGRFRSVWHTARMVLHALPAAMMVNA